MSPILSRGAKSQFEERGKCVGLVEPERRFAAQKTHDARPFDASSPLKSNVSYAALADGMAENIANGSLLHRFFFVRIITRAQLVVKRCNSVLRSPECASTQQGPLLWSLYGNVEAYFNWKMLETSTRISLQREAYFNKGLTR